MRLSSNPNDKDYWRNVDVRCPRYVLLNGIIMEGILEFDDEKGYVDIIDQDEKGRVIVRNGVVVTGRYTGRVDVMW